jgi:aldehyde dehydrogenase (NAD(P)+)
MDALYKSFVEGFVCVIKMNPVNEYLGPFFEEAFRPLIERNIWGVAFGGATEGRFLVEHDDVVDIHITGSDRTHDMIVWGPPGEERERRMKENDPVLKKRITSELGNVTPVVIVPGKYSPAELAFLAHNVASMVTNNGSFNCNAAKMIVLSKGWPQRDAFMSAVKTTLDSAPPRRAYYPGAGDRYEKLTEGRENVWKARGEREDGLQWAVIEHVDASDEEEALFQVEPFCGIISETALDPEDPAAFTDAATAFCNDRLWGTLSMTIAYPSAIEKNDTFQSALNRAIKELRYGTVAINQWSALCYGFVSPAWGGHPSATLKDIQSGLGWVHNTYMFEGIDKTVIRGPHIVKPKPPWFVGHKTAHEIGRKLVALEARPSFFKVPGVVLSALFG